MSGVLGVFMRDGLTAEWPVVAGMAATTPHRAPDGEWAVRDGSFAAVRQRTVTTVEDEYEREPVVDGAARLALFFDGRLDNRDELASMLRLDRPRASAWPDARLALEAWKAWGEAAPSRFLGDFAFVVWSAADRRVACVRDPMGVRPLFYHLGERALVFGSEIRQVLAHPLVPCKPDELTLAGLLQTSLKDGTRTLYEGVRRVLPAQLLAVDPRTARARAYWDADAGRELALGSDAEYAEAWREVFDRAVGARLRSRGAVGAYLSGGLDSSSVAVTARVLGPQTAAPLRAFSLVFSGEPCADEREYSDAVRHHADLAGEALTPPPLDPATSRAQVAARGELPDFPHDATGDVVRAAMSRLGIRVALTGSGGDVGLSGSHYHYADLLRRGALVRFCRRYVDVARQPAMGWFHADLLRCAVWPLLPFAARRPLRPIARALGVPAVPLWIASDFATRMGLRDAPPPRVVAPGRLARTDVREGFEDAWTHMALDMYQRGSTEWAIEDRHPFFDRRVVEFALSLPDEQRWQRGRSRYVLRNALGARLPSVVRDRPDSGKGDFSHVYLAPLEALGGEAFFSDSLVTAQAGWVVAAQARALLRRVRAHRAAGDPNYGDAAFRLWTIAAVEMWYAGIFGPRAGRKPWSIENSPAPRPAAAARGGSHIGVPC
jgi:asparagine synthase (glutamine-hydrolysing)